MIQPRGASRSAARRAAVKAHHPDGGGSADALIAALAQIDAPRYDGPIVARATRPRRTAVRRWWRRRATRHYTVLHGQTSGRPN